MSPILLENLLQLARAGAHIVPPLPAFYLKPDEATAQRIFVDHYCMRLLDLLGLPANGTLAVCMSLLFVIAKLTGS